MIARFGSINLEKFDKLRNFSSDETDDRISTVYFFLGNVSFRFSSRPSRIKSWKDLCTIKISLVSLNKIIEAISFVCYNVYYNDKKEGVIFVFLTKMASFSHQLLAQKDTISAKEDAKTLLKQENSYLRDWRFTITINLYVFLRSSTSKVTAWM